MKCDGIRPVCTPCLSKSIDKCVYDTKSTGESKSASLKSENQALRERLAALERSIRHICEMPAEQGRLVLSRVNRTSDPLSTLVSLHSGIPTPAISQAISETIGPAVQTTLERELVITNPLAYQTINPINVRSLVQEIPGDPFSLEPFRQLHRMRRLVLRSSGQG